MLHLPDANILIYAFLRSSPHHVAARCWLERTLGAGEEIALAEVVEVALLRVPTLPGLGDLAVPVDRVVEYWRRLRAHAGVRRVAAGSRHEAILSGLVGEHGIRGNAINDAWLAALAIEHGATLVSADKGFARFRRLRQHDPFGS